ncbi:MAG TPA: isoprenylcysteine carboxylmethyltransferase family protein [Allosphingosinicella sp.]|nr:isoprenylcysteine carboxylmethyltransferase family protein [Allosphingosinicella sp.]
MPASHALSAPARRRSQEERAVDIGERVLLMVFYGWFLSQIVPSVAGQPYNLLILASETLTAVLVLIRRPGRMATSFYAWAIAIIGTCAPLLVRPVDGGFIPIWWAALLMTFGLFVSLAAKLFLRRSFGIVAACRGVRREGPYRLVRHPMYTGYVITQLGFLLANPSLLNATVYAIAWGMLLLRIGEEEEMLSHDPAYRDYVASVRYRLMPGIY